MKRRRYQEPEEQLTETFDDIRAILLHVLRCQSCPTCLGTGRAPDGGKLPSGAPTFASCTCRAAARAFLEEFK